MKVFAVTLPVLKTADPPPPVPEAIRLPTLTVPLKFTGRKARGLGGKISGEGAAERDAAGPREQHVRGRTTSSLKF